VRATSKSGSNGASPFRNHARPLNPEVYCHYFVYTDREEDSTLKVLVKKTDTIKKELGSLSQVLEGRLAPRLGFPGPDGGAKMSDGLPWHRIQFAFTITYHYLFPQLTMGLALLIVVFKSLALRLRDEPFDEVARFWGRIFALNFAMGVVTGIPMEFQFGTNWSRFSTFSGEVVGQALAMEGVFAFFLESAFLGLFLFGERRLGPKKHLAAAVALALGSWLSGYFIIVANAFMQHPVG
jgi:hypothetical protein